jgi:RNA polymerase sigma-70 factor (ECF subfamily)
MEEHRAIERIKRGHLDGLEFLISKFQVKAVQTAYLILNDRGLAEDIVQSAFIKVTENINSFNTHRPFEPWFLRIVINSSLSAYQGLKRLVSIDEDELGPLPSWLIDSSQTLEELVETAETRREVLAALNELSIKQRSALVMRYYLEMSNQEISQFFQQPLTTTKWSLHSAKDRLRRLLYSIFPNKVINNPSHSS